MSGVKKGAKDAVVFAAVVRGVPRTPLFARKKRYGVSSTGYVWLKARQGRRMLNSGVI